MQKGCAPPLLPIRPIRLLAFWPSFALSCCNPVFIPTQDNRLNRPVAKQRETTPRQASPVLHFLHFALLCGFFAREQRCPDWIPTLFWAHIPPIQSRPSKRAPKRFPQRLNKSSFVSSIIVSLISFLRLFPQPLSPSYKTG